jgi:mannose-6-phosphate isomerase-like protein (cupin superfamily)
MAQAARYLAEEYVDACQVSEDWDRRGFGCDVRVDPPGQTWADIAYDTDQLIMPVEGELEIELSGKIHHLNPGEEIEIPAGVHLTVRNLNGRGTRWLCGCERECACTD